MCYKIKGESTLELKNRKIKGSEIKMKNGLKRKVTETEKTKLFIYVSERLTIDNLLQKILYVNLICKSIYIRLLDFLNQ